MASRIQFRRDTSAEWERVNPILANSEIGFILDLDVNGNQRSSLYKIGDGLHTWIELPLFGFNGNFSEDLESLTDEDHNTAVSKYALVEKFQAIQDALDEVDNNIGTIEIDVEELKKWSEVVKQSLADLEEKVPIIETTIEGHSASIEELSGITNSHAGRLGALENMHVVLSQSDYNDLKNADSLLEDVFYYTFEETE